MGLAKTEKEWGERASAYLRGVGLRSAVRSRTGRWFGRRSWVGRWWTSVGRRCGVGVVVGEDVDDDGLGAGIRSGGGAVGACAGAG